MSATISNLNTWSIFQIISKVRKKYNRLFTGPKHQKTLK